MYAFREDAEAGRVLDQDELLKLINGFKGSTLYEIVCVAAFTGMRRGEVLGLRWQDLDADVGRVRIAHAPASGRLYPIQRVTWSSIVGFDAEGDIPDRIHVSKIRDHRRIAKMVEFARGVICGSPADTAG